MTFYPNPSLALIAFSFAQHTPELDPAAFELTAAAERSADDAADVGVSEAELQAYVKAKARANEIAAFWKDSIERSRSAEVLRGVRENEIEIAVGLEGLSLERFREIDDQVEKNADLRQVVKMLARE